MKREAALAADADDAPIAHHYVLALVVEGLIFLALAWLQAHYR